MLEKIKDKVNQTAMPMDLEAECELIEDGFAGNIDDAYASGVEQGYANAMNDIRKILFPVNSEEKPVII